MDDRRENESDSEVVVIEIDSVANQNDTHLQENGEMITRHEVFYTIEH